MTAAVTPAVTVHGGFGTDDPDDVDFLTVIRRETRIENTAISFGFQHKASAQITWGVEYRRLDTKYLVAGDKDASHVNVGFTFTFCRAPFRTTTACRTRHLRDVLSTTRNPCCGIIVTESTCP